MTNPYEQNPFEVLRLPPGTSPEQVVAHAARLRQRCPSDEELTAIRQAVQALTCRPEDRFLQEMLTHPRPDYQQPSLDQFRAAFRRAPKSTAQPVQSCPAFDLAEFAELLRPIIAEQYSMVLLPFAEVPNHEPVEEIQRQSVEACWKCLVESV
jgi:hypothetical protein